MHFLQNIFHDTLQFLPKLAVCFATLTGIILVPLGLPGVWLIVAASLTYSYYYDFVPGSSDYWVNAMLFILALLAEILEFLVGNLGGKLMTEISTGAIISSIVGGLIGAIVGVPVFLIGSFLGLLLGAFLGALIYEFIVARDFAIALKSATAVFFSRMVASFLKTCIALGMATYLSYKLF